MNRLQTVVGQLHPASLSSGESKCPHMAKAARGQAPKPTVRVVVTGAAGNLAYSALFMVAQGLMLGADQPLELRLLDIPQMEKTTQGVKLELEDGAFPLVTKIVATSDYKVAFEQADYALLIGAKPRGPGMQRKDLLTANAAIFKGQGKALNDYASKNVKVLVVGNPANTNALIAAKNAPNIKPENFTAMTRLDQNRAVGMLSQKLGVSTSRIKNVIIWGNHSKTQYPDVNEGVVADYPAKGFVTPLRAAVNDDTWLNGKFIEDVQDRGAVIIKWREKSSAASAAAAAVDHMRSWALGTPEGESVSMGVYSNGNPYGVPNDIVYSFPCTCKDGVWSIVKGIKFNEFSAKKMKDTADELLDEKQQAGY